MLISCMQDSTMAKVDKITHELKHNKGGIWLAELARLAGVSEGSIRYLVYGQDKNGEHYGGYLQDQIVTSRQGRNLVVRIKT